MNATQPLGTLTRDNEHCTVTFIRELPYPVEKVWRAVTETEHLGAWFPDQIVGERRAGAPLRFVPHGQADADGFDGEMVAFEPPSRMELLWGVDHLRIELEPHGDGTRLTLAHTFTELGKAARDGAGWHECLDRLLASMNGEALPAWGTGYRAVHPSYVDVLGEEASTIGPPPGWDDAS
jgi:uncharacterized protein YndB with AHSA1/START domain